MAIKIKCPQCGLEFGDNDAIQENINKALIQQKKELESTHAQALEQVKLVAKLEASQGSSNAMTEANIEIARLKQENESIKIQKEQELQNQKQVYTNNLQAMDREQKSQIEKLELKKANDIEQSINKYKSEIQTLQNDIKLKDTENELSQQKLKENYEFIIQRANEDLQREKELKAALNVKLTGENLEQHCQNEFELYRNSFPNAKFCKDNQVVENTKGDFIFRDYDNQGNEILSIMFEMKNENTSSETKQKNDIFFDKLDKDRNKKKCEYAVLVTLLEQGNPVYDRGIVDKSLDFNKMYVIRPQFFIPIINMLKSAAQSTIKDKQALMEMKNQNFELVTFEQRIQDFKDGFVKNYNIADKQFNSSISEIDKTIKSLEKTKEDLLKAARQLGLAKDKTEDLTIRKLTKGLPSVSNMIQQNDNKKA